MLQFMLVFIVVLIKYFICCKLYLHLSAAFCHYLMACSVYWQLVAEIVIVNRWFRTQLHPRQYNVQFEIAETKNGRVIWSTVFNRLCTGDWVADTRVPFVVIRHLHRRWGREIEIERIYRTGRSAVKSIDGSVDVVHRSPSSASAAASLVARVPLQGWPKSRPKPRTFICVFAKYYFSPTHSV